MLGAEVQRPGSWAISCGSTMCSDKRDFYPNIEFRIILLHLVGAVLAFELLDNGMYFGFVRNGPDFSAPFFSIGGQEHRGRLQNVLVPVAIRTLHGQQIKFVAFLNEPYWVGNLAAGCTAGDRYFNFVGVLERLRKFGEGHVNSPSFNHH